MQAGTRFACAGSQRVDGTPAIGPDHCILRRRKRITSRFELCGGARLGPPVKCALHRGGAGRSLREPQRVSPFSVPSLRSLWLCGDPPSKKGTYFLRPRRVRGESLLGWTRVEESMYGRLPVDAPR